MGKTLEEIEKELVEKAKEQAKEQFNEQKKVLSKKKEIEALMKREFPHICNADWYSGYDDGWQTFFSIVLGIDTDNQELRISWFINFWPSESDGGYFFAAIDEYSKNANQANGMLSQALADYSESMRVRNWGIKDLLNLSENFKNIYHECKRLKSIIKSMSDKEKDLVDKFFSEKLNKGNFEKNM